MILSATVDRQGRTHVLMADHLGILGYPTRAKRTDMAKICPVLFEG